MGITCPAIATTKPAPAESMALVTVMSKFLIMGIPLDEVIRESTVNPAREIGHEELGHLSVGAVADIAGLKVLEGDFGYTDVASGLLRGTQRIVGELTLQIRGEAGRRQVEGARIGISANQGLFGHGSGVLGRR